MDYEEELKIMRARLERMEPALQVTSLPGLWDLFAILSEMAEDLNSRLSALEENPQKETQSAGSSAPTTGTAEKPSSSSTDRVQPVLTANQQDSLMQSVWAAISDCFNSFHRISPHMEYHWTSGRSLQVTLSWPTDSGETTAGGRGAVGPESRWAFSPTAVCPLSACGKPRRDHTGFEWIDHVTQVSEQLGAVDVPESECVHELGGDFAKAGLRIAMTNSIKREREGLPERLTVTGNCVRCGTHLLYALDLVAVGGRPMAVDNAMLDGSEAGFWRCYCCGNKNPPDRVTCVHCGISLYEVGKYKATHPAADESPPVQPEHEHDWTGRSPTRCRNCPALLDNGVVYLPAVQVGIREGGR